MEERIVSLLGGRIAEKLILSDISTGASNDIQRATSIARAMVTQYGMSEKLGPIVYDSDNGEVFLGRDFGHTKSYSEKVAAIIDDEVKLIIDTAYNRCEAILKDNMDILELTAQYLLANENMDAETFKYLCDNRSLPEAKAEEVPAAVEEPAVERAEAVIESETEIKTAFEELFGSDETAAENEETEE